eukprot:2930897-Rhodomonas_salina.3
MVALASGPEGRGWFNCRGPVHTPCTTACSPYPDTRSDRYTESNTDRETETERGLTLPVQLMEISGKRAEVKGHPTCGGAPRCRRNRGSRTEDTELTKAEGAHEH